MTVKQRYWLKFVFIFLTLGYMIFSVVAFSYRSNETMCSGLTVVVEDSAKLRFVSPSDVSLFLSEGDLNPLGIRYDCIDEAQVETCLESQPRIKKAECYKTPSGVFVVSVQQREPIVRVMTNEGSYYVDLDGNLMAVSSDFSAYVPIVTGVVSKEIALNELYQFAIYLHSNPFWKAQIEQVHFETERKVILIPRVGNHVVELGSLDDYEQKLKKLYSLYRNGFSKVGWNYYKKINLSYENQAVCTKR